MSGAPDLKLGFVPLNDAAPLIVAAERGLFAAEGLNVTLVREVSWATVRDKVAAGALDAAHMLAAIPLACTLGVGGVSQSMIAPLALNRSGAAVTLARRLDLRSTAGEGRAEALARRIAERRASGAPPLTLAVVFPFSMHNYLLRFWLAEAGIDPDRDVRITVAPPSRMTAKLAAGELDGFCAGEPWNAQAEADGAGEVVVRAEEIWPHGPEKVLGIRADWADRNRAELQGLMRALLKAAVWSDVPDNRAELAALLARQEYVGVDARLIEASLGRTVFHRDGANAPLPGQAGWLLSQMMRWGQVPAEINIPVVARSVCRPDLYAEAARAVGLTTATEEPTQMSPGGRVFRLQDASAYAAAFPIGRMAEA